MAEGPIPKNWYEAVPWVTWGAVIFTFFFVFVEKLVEGAYGETLTALIGGLGVTAVALHSKTWLQKTNPNWAFVAALALLFAVISMPWVEQKKWPFSVWFYDSAPAEARESTLIEWLRLAQQQRAQAIAERDSAQKGWAADRLAMESVQSQSAETHRQLVDAEAQKSTLIEWLQTAQHERDDVRQELQRQSKPSSAFMAYPQPVYTKEQECADFAHKLGDLDPAWSSEKVQIEHIRSIMTSLGCGCDASKK